MPKISARRKGTDFQRWIKTWLEERGWKVFNMPIGHRFQKARDIFGVDLVCKHPDHNRTLWIQAKGSSRPNLKKTLEPMVGVPWNRGCDRIQIWIKRKATTIDVMELTTNEGLRSMGKIISRHWYSAEGVSFDF